MAPIPNVKNVTVFGAGLMGSGIAQVTAQGGYNVMLADVSDKALANGIAIIKKSVARVAKKAAPNDVEAFVTGVMARIKTTTDPAAAVKDADLVIESIIESLKLKQDLFAALDKVAKPEAVFCSNTSALLISEIAATCSEERKKVFGGLHFSNPVPMMRLVEVIRTDVTDQKTYETLFSFGKSVGKVPVTCKDTPGFIMNRLLLAYNREAVRMVERGDATFEDIDKAMELGAGYPMGPFKLFDYVGLDTAVNVGKGWEERAKQGWISKELVEQGKLIPDLVAKGHLGRKSGKGFYDYSNEKNKLR